MTAEDWGVDAELNTAERPLLDPQTVARLAFEQAPTAICVYDHLGNVQVANDAHISFVRAFGADCDARGVAGDPRGGVRPRPSGAPLRSAVGEEAAAPSSFELHRDHLQAAYAGEGREYRFSCMRANNPDDLVYFDRVLLPLPREAERALAVVSAIVDVSERVRAEEERAALQERLSRADKLQSLGLLAGGIAHDFNNLLQPVLGNVSLLEKRVAHDPELLEHVRAIGAASRRAGEVARLMLEYAGRRRPRAKELPLAATLHEAVQLLRPSWPATVRVETEVDDPLPTVRADEVQIRRVVMNLLQNAYEAMGDQPGTVALRARELSRAEVDLEDCLGRLDSPAERFVEIRVEDDGPGMSQDVLARVFDPFYSTKRPGRGFGLSAVLGIVTAHGGVLRADSAPRRGTRMSVYLPAASCALSVGKSKPARAGAQPGLRGLKVLVVDDLASVREIVEKMLRVECCSVESVCSGEEALSRIESHPEDFSVVCLDVEMPGLSGVEVRRRLAKLAPELPVVLMSGHGRPAELTAEAFLEKPFSVDDFVRAYRVALVAGLGGAKH